MGGVCYMAITRSRRKNRQLKNNEYKSLDLSKESLVTKSENEIFVKSKEKLGKKIVELIISIILWLNMLIILYFFISACFNYNDNFIGILKSYFKVTNNDIQYFVKLSIMYFCLSYIILFSWKMYNKKRFGNLQRREESKPTSDEEMLSLGLIKPEVYKILQADKIIIFDENPVKDLSRRS